MKAIILRRVILSNFLISLCINAISISFGGIVQIGEEGHIWFFGGECMGIHGEERGVLFGRVYIGSVVGGCRVGLLNQTS